MGGLRALRGDLLPEGGLSFEPAATKREFSARARHTPSRFVTVSAEQTVGVVTR